MQTMNALQRFFSSRHSIFFVLCIFFLAARIIPVWGNNFPFQYDNAKDSLVMYNMWAYKDPVLVGPTTSISGLFYGPAWYYVALPLNILTQFHPYSGVVTVLIFGIANLALFYYLVGFWPALLYATSVGVIGTQQNAWTPYMTSLIMTPLLFLLLHVAKNQKKMTVKVAGLIGFFTSLFFHTEVAYAIVFLLLLFVFLFFEKKKLSLTTFFVGCAVFLSTLVPSALFELKHDFLQTKAVMNFIQNFGRDAHVVQPNQKGFLRIIEIGKYVTDNAAQSITPIANVPFMTLIALAIITAFLWKVESYQRKLILLLVLGTFLLYLFLPAKPFYFVALSPLWIYCAGSFFEKITSKQMSYLAIAILLLSLAQISQNQRSYQRYSESDAFLYKPKVDAVRQVYTLSQNAPFSSYQFVPEVYDYTYQFIFIREYLLGKMVANEISYLPGKKDYFIGQFPEQTQPSTQFFLIIEKPVYQDVQDKWLSDIENTFEPTGAHKINDAISVYSVQRK